MAANYAAREDPSPEGMPLDLPGTQAARCAALRHASIEHLGHRHAKTQALAVELYHDWDAIFNVLRHPHLPLTNNDAERVAALGDRPAHQSWHPYRSRLACVHPLGQCHRHLPSTRALAVVVFDAVIAERRLGRALPALPQAGI